MSEDTSNVKRDEHGFREMRRRKQELPREACDEVLRRATSGVLAVAGDGGYPYAVPLSYVYDGERIFFHCATSGHKLDAVRRDPRASFCVIDQDQVVPEKYTTLFRSVIAFGMVRELTDDAEKRAAIELLAERYAPEEGAENRNREIENFWKSLCMLELRIEHLSGKEAIEVVRARSAEGER